MLPPVFFVCSVCGSVVTVDASPGYRCPQGASDGDGAIHRLVREIEPRRLQWPEVGPDNPLLRYRHFSSPYLRFRVGGGTDADYVEKVIELETIVSGATKARFRASPLTRSDALEIATGREGRGSVFLQDRTSFAGGPGTWLGLAHALLPEWLGIEGRPIVTMSLAEDSSDASALAGILGRPMETLPAPSSSAADYFPWTGWRDLNAWVLEGESHWAYMAVDRLRRMGETVDRVFLPPDGRGSAGWALGLREAFRLGATSSLPRIHIVEEEGTHRVGHRYDATLREILGRVDETLLDPNLEDMSRRFLRVRRVFADQILRGLRSEEADHPVRAAVESGLRSVLESLGPGIGYEEILVRAMIESGGFPVEVNDDDLVRGRMLSRREPPPDTSGGTAHPAGDATLSPLADEAMDSAQRVPGTAGHRYGLSSAGMLRLFAGEDLGPAEVLLAVDP